MAEESNARNRYCASELKEPLFQIMQSLFHYVAENNPVCFNSSLSVANNALSKYKSFKMK